MMRPFSLVAVPVPPVRMGAIAQADPHTLPDSRSRIIVTSGCTDSSMRRYGLIDQTTRFLPKTYTMDDLTRIVREELDS
jgi:hypothetical protein